MFFYKQEASINKTKFHQLAAKVARLEKKQSLNEQEQADKKANLRDQCLQASEQALLSTEQIQLLALKESQK